MNNTDDQLQPESPAKSEPQVHSSELLCGHCDGCGQIANDEDGTPWKHWLEMPLGSSAAVLLGLVKPIPCPKCGGSGRPHNGAGERPGAKT